MKKTREIILQTSLRLFNEQGLTNTTLRNIASEMGISQGNLNYHFKKKEELVEALYFELVHMMDVNMKDMSFSTNSIENLYKVSHAGIMQMFEYRFILLDFLQVMKEHPKIREHYLELQVLRKKQFLGVFDQLVSEGLLQPASFELEYERLYERMNIIGDYWINAFYIDQFKKKHDKEYFIKLLFEIIYPYLTKKGQSDYKKALYTD